MPDTPPRSYSYTVGGLSPYGFTRTPPYNNKWVPNVFEDTSLYERMDFDSAVKGTEGKDTVSNPPLLVAGSVTGAGRTPSWMMDDKHNVKRILRGYIRRDDPYQWTTGTDVSNRDKSSNARLYFMYNPTSVTRTYAALDDVSKYQNLYDDPSGMAPPFLAAAEFELFFDRQQEVATLPNNPGCLVDLAVFDLLVGNGSAQGTLSRDPEVAGGHGLPLPAIDSLAPPSSENTQSLSLMWDPSIMLVVNISPNLAFRGTISSAYAVFEKFSSRMTPMRMTLVLNLRLYSIGQEPSIKYRGLSSADSASAAATKKLADPTQTATSQEAADKANRAGRTLAMQWGEHWVGKVKYIEAKRCEHDSVMQDSVSNYEDPHIPTGFDCSSFVSRCLCVAGLGSALGIGPCSDSGTYVAIAISVIKSSTEHPWKVIDLQSRSTELRTGAWSSAAAAFIQAGDILVRARSDKQGHVAFVKEVEVAGEKWKIMHAPAPDKMIEIVSTTASHVLSTYSYIMRSQPVAYVAGSTGATGGAKSGAQ